MCREAGLADQEMVARAAGQRGTRQHHRQAQQGIDVDRCLLLPGGRGRAGIEGGADVLDVAEVAHVAGTVKSRSLAGGPGWTLLEDMGAKAWKSRHLPVQA